MRATIRRSLGIALVLASVMLVVVRWVNHRDNQQLLNIDDMARNSNTIYDSTKQVDLMTHEENNNVHGSKELRRLLANVPSEQYVPPPNNSERFLRQETAKGKGRSADFNDCSIVGKSKGRDSKSTKASNVSKASKRSKRSSRDQSKDDHGGTPISPSEPTISPQPSSTPEPTAFVPSPVSPTRNPTVSPEPTGPTVSPEPTNGNDDGPIGCDNE